MNATWKQNSCIAAGLALLLPAWAYSAAGCTGNASRPAGNAAGRRTGQRRGPREPADVEAHAGAEADRRASSSSSPDSEDGEARRQFTKGGWRI